MEKVYVVKTSKGKWDSWSPITVAICTTMWKAEMKREEWLQKVKEWENKYSIGDQYRLNKEWEELPRDIKTEDIPKHLLDYDRWIQSEPDNEYEKYSEQVNIEEVELDTILYTFNQ